MSAVAPPALASFRTSAAQEVRISRSDWKGVALVDIRVHGQFGGPAKVYMPTRQGLSVQVDQLPELIAALQEAHAMIGGGD